MNVPCTEQHSHIFPPSWTVSCLTCHDFLWEPKRVCGQMQSQGLCPINSTLLQDSLCHLAPLCTTPHGSAGGKMTWRGRQKAQNLCWHQGCSQPWLWFENNHNPCNREELDAHCSVAYSGPITAPRTCTHIFPQTSRHQQTAWSTVTDFSAEES